MLTPWNCTHCGQRHRTEEQEAKCDLDKKRSDRKYLAMFIAIVIALGGLSLAWNQYVYGDWSCAFSECRRIMAAP